MDQTQLDTAWHSRSSFMNESKRHRQQRAVREEPTACALRTCGWRTHMSRLLHGCTQPCKGGFFSSLAVG
eukprot:4235408-Prymnesium_polylepis.1